MAPLRADRRARFLLVGAVLATVPTAATFPSGRLMLFPSIGLLGLLAMVAVGVVDGTLAWRPGPMRWAAVFTAAWMGGRHFFLSPLSIHIPLRQMAMMEKVIAGYGEGFGDDPALRHQRVVVVNPPDAFFTYFTASMRITAGRIAPERLLTLASGRRAIELERPDANTLVVRSEGGFYRQGTELLMRSLSVPMPEGTRVELTGVTVEVTRATAEGVPTEATFHFACALEDEGLKWMAWRGKTFVPFEVPKVGERRRLEAQTPTL
jgi:hypothetical protein